VWSARGGLSALSRLLAPGDDFAVFRRFVVASAFASRAALSRVAAP